MYLEAIKEVGAIICGLAFAVTLIMLTIWGLLRRERQRQIDDLNKTADNLLLAQWPLPDGQETQPLFVLSVPSVQDLGKPEFASLLRQLNESFTDTELDGLYRVCQEMEKRV